MKVRTLVSALFFLSAIPAMAFSDSNAVNDVLNANIGTQRGVSAGAVPCEMEIQEEAYSNGESYTITLSSSGEVQGMYSFRSGEFEMESKRGRKSIVRYSSSGGGLGSVLGNRGPRVKETVRLNLNAQKAIVGFDMQQGDDEVFCDFTGN